MVSRTKRSSSDWTNPSQPIKNASTDAYTCCRCSPALQRRRRKKFRQTDLNEMICGSVSASSRRRVYRGSVGYFCHHHQQQQQAVERQNNLIDRRPSILLSVDTSTKPTTSDVRLINCSLFLLSASAAVIHSRTETLKKRAYICDATK